MAKASARESHASRRGSLPDGFCACPIDTAFDVIGRKWTVQLVRALLEGNHQFNQFLERIEGINPKMLSARLKDLEHEKLIVRRVVATSPVRVHYELTQKGLDILPLLRMMARWSVQWAPERIFSGGKRPASAERCLDQWQSFLLDLEHHLVVRRGLEIVAVSFRKRGPRAHL